MIVPLLLIVGLALMLIMRARSKRRGPTAPSCGACGYAVAGLESLKCPECGADLREVGIVTPSTRAPSVLPVVFLSSLALGFVLLIGATVLNRALWAATQPAPTRYGTLTLAPRVPGAISSVRLEWEEGRGGAAPMSVQVALIDSARRARFRATVLAGRKGYRIEPLEGLPSVEPFGPALETSTIKSWFEQVMGQENEAAPAMAEDLAKILDAPPSLEGGHGVALAAFPSASLSTRTLAGIRGRSPGSFVTLGSVLLWVGGTIWIWRVASRRAGRNAAAA